MYQIDNSRIEAGDVVIALESITDVMTKGNLYVMDTGVTFINKRGDVKFRFFRKLQKLRTSHELTDFNNVIRTTISGNGGRSRRVPIGSTYKVEQLFGGGTRVEVSGNYYYAQDFKQLFKIPIIDLRGVYRVN